MTDPRIQVARQAIAGATPGPWVFGNTGMGHRLILGGPNQRYVCSVQIHQTPRDMGAFDEPEREANARQAALSPLIPAALDLMAAALNVREFGDSSRDELDAALDACLAALPAVEERPE